MRITRGLYKGRVVNVPVDIRPVSDRVRASCFNVVINIVEGASVADLFAGSGALGFEALSCGAKDCLFVDISTTGLDIVRRNAQSIGAERFCKFALGDAMEKVKDFHRKNIKFDLVFLDPPYYTGMLNKILQTISEYDIVSHSGFLACFCYGKDEFLKEYGPFKLVAEKHYGQTVFLVYEKSDLSGDV